MRVSTTIPFITVAVAASCAARPTIEWHADTLQRVTPGTYGRLARLSEHALILSYEAAGKSFVRRSEDGGRSWGNAIEAARSSFGLAANPQPLVLDDGTVWLLWNERPRDGVHPFAIRLTTSADFGRTWTARDEPLYTAGVEAKKGCWEPAAVQLANGDVHVFFANEGPYTKSDEQDITRLVTRDHGRTWSPPESVSFRPHFRDGMPVPIVLADSASVALAIEDNGLQPGGQMKPAIVRLSPATTSPVSPPSTQRWGALAEPLANPVYAGAPYLIRLPNGATLLSLQSKENSLAEQMVVYLGDANARVFAHPTRPFPSDIGQPCLWNSLFVKDAKTVIAIGNTTIDGKHGVWTIEGTVAP